MIEFFLSYFLIYQYFLLFFVVVLASFGLPLPATALLVAAGAFAAQGYLEIESIVFWWILSRVLGDTISYFVALRYGRRSLARVGFGSMLQSPKFTTIEELFKKYTKTSIFLSRFLVTNLGPVVNILAGLWHISFKKFLLFGFLGEVLYVLIFSGLGYIFSDQWEVISSIAGNITSVLVLIIILVVITSVFLIGKSKLEQ